MSVIPNAYVIATNKNSDSIFLSKSGILLLPDRIRITTAHAIGMYCSDRVLSNIFYAVRLKKETDDKLKALCVWLNTTWGILSILANKQETEGGWIRLKMSQWKLLPVLDIHRLSNQMIKKLAKIFDRYNNIDFGRLPEQYRQSKSASSIRKNFDMEFLNAIELTAMEDDLLEIYEQINSALQQWLG